MSDQNNTMVPEFIWPLRVYYEDTDAGGVVFYANYLKFFERARTELLRSYGFEQDDLIKHENAIFVVRSVQVDYLKPAFFNDMIDVSAVITEVKKTGFMFFQEIRRGEEILCSGRIRIVCLDATKMKPRGTPTIILEHFS